MGNQKKDNLPTESGLFIKLYTIRFDIAFNDNFTKTFRIKFGDKNPVAVVEIIQR